MTADLGAFLNIGEWSEPEWLVEEWQRLLQGLQGTLNDDTCGPVLAEFATSVDSWVADGRISGHCAGTVMFVAVALRVAHEAEGPGGVATVLGYLTQLTLSDEQWSQFCKAFNQDTGASAGESEDGLRRMTLHELPFKLLLHFFNRGRLAFLKMLFVQVYEGIGPIARNAMKELQDFAEWYRGLTLLAAHLTMRRHLPLTIDANANDEAPHAGRIELFVDENQAFTGGRFVAPPQVTNPLVEALFDPAEIADLNRHEAYAAECFAHLFTAFNLGLISEEGQAKKLSEFAAREATDRLDARQWLAFGKSRFEIGPYLGRN